MKVIAVGDDDAQVARSRDDTMLSHHKKAALFLVLTFVISWTLAFAFFASGGRTYSASWFVAAILFMFTPMVSAIAVQKFIYGWHNKSLEATALRTVPPLTRWDD